MTSHSQVLLAPAPAITYLRFKRILDFTFSLMLLIALAPLFLVIALAITLDSPGPVFFLQERVGSRRITTHAGFVWVLRNFRMIKFRSMQHHADETAHQEHIQAYVQGETGEGAGRALKPVHDKRVTRVGAVLRRFSVDELPQLLNVLKGEMSLIGPRPVPLYEFDAYPDSALGRFAATPGMTGLWQVRGRCSLSFQEQIALDIAYTERQSLELDLKILLWTVPAVLFCRGAE
ncbi:MAG: sugar transferase [Anaerolineae bacterium]|nr:sugar transferase [Anaerolineae bacterium]